VEETRLLPTQVQRRHHASHVILELATLGGIDERVDAAVGEHQDDAEVVEPIDETVVCVKDDDVDEPKDGFIKRLPACVTDVVGLLLL